MKKLILIAVVLLLAACDSSSSKSTSPVDPDIPSDPDYSAIVINSFELVSDDSGEKIEIYYLAEVENSSSQSFTDLYFDATGWFSSMDDLFDLAPNEIKIIDSRDTGARGTGFTSGTYETTFIISAESGDIIVATAYDSITL